ncbi:hypothetical protein CF319_g4941 [Tilletia indica]|uniref:Uncharacterized protein n=1 Tax=Tilletia indica TaxID=43049 RepID=A0A177T2P5_9BASI|nr:hypothetical protein CF326_g9210 [Tilletia indica]KAE8221746.1 hypothetical protein CF319_g4941 [Tilletia indica]KAE8237100.1 hypothetical protein A4X13_0g8909 [Tilletia indica]
MVHFRMLIALLPFLVSNTFALPLEGTSPGRSPTALHPAGAIRPSNIRDVYFPSHVRLGFQREGSSDWESPTYLSAEAAEKARLLMRGDPPIKEAIKAYDEAARLASSSNTEANKIFEALRKGEPVVVKVPLGKFAQAAQHSRPPSRIPWPKPGDRLNLEGSNHYENPPSTPKHKTPKP